MKNSNTLFLTAKGTLRVAAGRRIAVLVLAALTTVAGTAPFRMSAGWAASTPQGSAVAAASAKDAVVLTAKGALRGIPSGDIFVFKGIPFAKPPVGALRFAPPEDVDPWQGERDATKFGPASLQLPMTMTQGFIDEVGLSEDCLTLNIWTPKLDKGAKLPVYVWIHGGGYTNGAGSMPDFDMTRFAREGVVGVTINYRLGVMGFFASNTTLEKYGTTGNWGTLDQIKALEWVRDNIEAFGGDPNRVTIGGESAGSFSVGALLLSPPAGGLFQRAIMESGSILSVKNNTPPNGPVRVEAPYAALANVFGAADNEAGLAKLRAADAETLASLNADLSFNFATVGPQWLLMPFFDDKVLPRNPRDALSKGKFNKADLLFGYNADEGASFVPLADELAYKGTITRQLGYENLAGVVSRYPVDAQHPALARTREILALSMFSAPMKVFGDAYAKAGHAVYAYNFRYVESGNPGGLGAYHVTEISFGFGNADGSGVFGSGTPPTSAKIALMEDMHARWVNFIKTGDPNHSGGVTWPAYDPASASAIHFGDNARPDDGEVSVGPLIYRDDIDFINSLPRK
ncbi:MAG: carboxylesterase family protein [Methylobacteriaceae bacterium]|jgi:para-nitrobenzyl esterase|nr:carboxylesterase family protein [Methylobacteriaceae bacterium]